jgi:putative Mg2+ transporter-C (MgtC) family protein
MMWQMTVLQIFLPLGLAFGCGFVLGLERELAHKPAGLRTQVLICLGATIFVVGGQLYGHEPARISANVITGLGFLGAGVIIKHQGSIRGMTTAALIWINGSLGLAIGLNQYVLAGSGTLLVLIALRALGALEKRMRSKCQIVHYTIRTRESEEVMTTIHEALAHCHLLEQPLTFGKSADGLNLRFAFCNPPQKHEEFVDRLRKLPDTLSVEAEK